MSKLPGSVMRRRLADDDDGRRCKRGGEVIMRQPAGGIFWEHLASCLLPPSSTTDFKVPLLVDVSHFTDLLSVCLFVVCLFVYSFVYLLVC